MIDENPYSPPDCEETLAEPDWPTSGAFREGKFLVLHAGSPLPTICVRTGRPADDQCRLEMQCLGGDDLSVSAKTSTFWSGTWYEFSVPVHSNWLWRQRRANFIARAILIAGMVSLTLGVIGAVSVSATTVGETLGSLLAFGCVLLGVLLLGIGSVLQDSWRPLRSVHSISRGYFWILGANSAYLDQLPPWPIPKSSIWRTWLGSSDA